MAKDQSDNIASHNEFDDTSSCNERGSIEAGLTLIPATAFFLLVMQLVIAGSFQVVETIDLQNIATRSALSDSGEFEYAFENDRETSGQLLQLPGGGELILVKSKVAIPRVIDLSLAGQPMSAQTLVVRE